MKGFCKSASLDEIKKHGYILTPGLYVGIEDVEADDEEFEEKMKRLTLELSGQMKKTKELYADIKTNFGGIGYDLP